MLRNAVQRTVHRIIGFKSTHFTDHLRERDNTLVSVLDNDRQSVGELVVLFNLMIVPVVRRRSRADGAILEVDLGHGVCSVKV